MNSVASRASFRVASYNVLNLFDKVDDPDKRDEGTRPKCTWSESTTLFTGHYPKKGVTSRSRPSHVKPIPVAPLFLHRPPHA